MKSECTNNIEFKLAIHSNIFVPVYLEIESHTCLNNHRTIYGIKRWEIHFSEEKGRTYRK